MRQTLDPATLAEHVVAGSRAHVARALTLVESSRPDHRDQERDPPAERAQDLVRYSAYVVAGDDRLQRQ